MVKKISVKELRLGMFIHKLGGSWIQHPFFRSSFLLTDQKDLRKIVDSGIQEIWIDQNKGVAATEKVSAKSVNTVPSTTPVKSVKASPSAKKNQSSSMDLELEKARKLCSAGKQQVMEMFNQARLGKAIDPQTTLPLVTEIESAVERNAAAILSVARLKTHDDYTYMHSVAVCALMLALARQMSLSDEMTRLAGIGGLMHDLGKSFMPLEILNKPGKLTDEEYEVMKQHPAAGAKLLEESGAEPEVVDIALYHHEKVSGFGYPKRLKGEEIPLLARMGAICDVYDAVTSERAYKKPWAPANTIREMARWEGHFDKDIFNAFVKSVGIYPMGSLVRLSSQRLAVVVEPNEGALLKPKVKVFFNLRMKETIPVQVIDLAAPSCKEKIEGPEDPDAWEFKNLDSLWQ